MDMKIILMNLATPQSPNSSRKAILSNLGRLVQTGLAESASARNVKAFDGKYIFCPSDAKRQLYLNISLPRSGAIIFTIRTYIEPVTKLAEEPGVPGRMADAIRSWPPEVAEYKGQHLYADALLCYLDEQHKEQVDRGIVLEDQKDINYPF